MDENISIDDNDVITIVNNDVKNEKAAKRYLFKNCSDAVMHTLEPGSDFVTNLNRLNTSYGFANVDLSVILKDIIDIAFRANVDPMTIFDFVDKKLAELESAGGSMTNDALVRVVFGALSSDPNRNQFCVAI